MKGIPSLERVLLEGRERLVEPVQAEKTGKQNVEYCKFQVFPGYLRRSGREQGMWHPHWDMALLIS